jgi:protein-tyrosine phosphatase
LCAIGSEHVLFEAALPLPGTQDTMQAHRARIIYLALDLADRPDEDILSHFPRVCNWLRTALEYDSNRVLVHCVAGVSRSATLVIAFLMMTEGLTAARAFEEVAAVRSCCNPNRGFRAQLIEFEISLEAERQQAGLPPLMRIDAERSSSSACVVN